MFPIDALWRRRSPVWGSGTLSRKRLKGWARAGGGLQSVEQLTKCVCTLYVCCSGDGQGAWCSVNTWTGWQQRWQQPWRPWLHSQLNLLWPWLVWHRISNPIPKDELAIKVFFQCNFFHCCFCCCFLCCWCCFYICVVWIVWQGGRAEILIQCLLLRNAGGMLLLLVVLLLLPL